MANKPTAVIRESGKRVSTGIAGLDAILGGGLPEHRIYLVEGTPGTGKTTLLNALVALIPDKDPLP